ncbi:MAG: 3'-5' exonuclease [Proteobacteria bacterium]|nr:3'-5' exonuclease [Pseudomonadota bacterium]
MLSFDLSVPWREMSLISVDVEATGLDTDEARITEIGMVRFERGQVADRWGTLVNPGVPIPPESTKVTNITDEMVADKPSFRDIKWEVYGRLRDKVFVAYNAPYDLAVIGNELARCGLTLPVMPVMDPLVWARALMATEMRHNLGAICSKLGIPLENAHRAEDDAEAAGKVLFRLADKVPMELGSLLAEQKEWMAVQEEAADQRRTHRQVERELLGKTPRKKAAKDDDSADASAGQAGLF